MIDFDTLHALVRVKGPTCSARDCDHPYCCVVRTLHSSLAQGEGLVLASPDEIKPEAGG